MAYPPDPPNHAGSPSAALAGSRLTPEEAERLAATFRPSWELDDAPFTAPVAVADAGLPAARGNGTQADVRSAVQALNGTHAPAPATVLRNEPTNSVILGGGIDAEEAPTRVHRSPADPVAAAKAISAPLAPVVLGPSRVAQVQPSSRHSSSGARVSAASHADRVPKRSRLGPWLGLGAAGIGIVIGAWLAAGSGDKRDAAAPPVDTPVVTTASPIPPPPPATETTQAVAAPAPPPPVQATTASPPPPLPVVAAEPVPRAASTPPVAVPVTPTPTPRPAATSRAPSWGGGAAPAPKPPPRPKSPGSTIVRDVPF